MHPFEALAEPVRRRIIEILASGEHTSGQLADVVGPEFRISRTAVSKHLRLLRDAKCVDVRAEENWRWYRLSSEGLEALESAVADIRQRYAGAIGWDADAGTKRDPLARTPRYPSVPFRGPGRAPRRGRRGRQTTFAQWASPDDLPPPRPIIDWVYEWHREHDEIALDGDIEDAQDA
ncbi:ArsR/SmtB family transcription factor [Microbacterium sp. E-13]|uniref:ArsR/SmtB family transcription factor n=1 Tax=Microbacterium sp. E-13 TaxID=3404048 RepID=UPI003CF4329F